MPTKKKSTKQPKKVDRQIEVNDIAELLVALDKKMTDLENKVKDRDSVISKLKDRLGIE